LGALQNLVGEASTLKIPSRPLEGIIPNPKLKLLDQLSDSPRTPVYREQALNTQHSTINFVRWA
jgi:hypothetical protein